MVGICYEWMDGWKEGRKDRSEMGRGREKKEKIPSLSSNVHETAQAR